MPKAAGFSTHYNYKNSSTIYNNIFLCTGGIKDSVSQRADRRVEKHNLFNTRPMNTPPSAMQQ